MESNNEISDVNLNKRFKNPNNIQYLSDLTDNSYSEYILDNNFAVFKSISNIIYLIYSTFEKSIISINLINNQIMNIIKNAHNYFISNIRYFLDKKTKKEFILSVSPENRNIKVWHLRKWECLFNMENIYNEGLIYSACFILDYCQIYIVISHHSKKCCENIKVYDLSKKLKKEIYESDDETFFIDSFYDKKNSKNFIITGNLNYVKSFDFTRNRLYHEYKDKQNCKSEHTSIIIDKDNEILRLIESSKGGYIRLWNFHTGELISRISNNGKINCICLWNTDYLFVGFSSGKIRILELKTKKYIKDNEIYSNALFCDLEVLSLKKIIHPKFGECLICQGYKDSQITIFSNEV